MSINAQYDKAFTDAAADALRTVVASKPSTSVADLRALISDHPALGDITLGALLGRGAAGTRGAKARTAKQPKAAKVKTTKPQSVAAAKPGKRTSKSRDGWDTRTDEGRAALDRAVIEALSAFGGIAVSAEAIRARLGATPPQLRSSLGRHVEAGDVSVTGKARGTRYTLE